MRYKNRLLASVLVVTASLVILPAAASNVAAQSNSLAQGFRADTSQGPLVSGALVGLKQKSNNTVELASTSNGASLLGVVDSDSLVTISQAPEQVKVVLTGTTTALVSDINGKLKIGDKVTVSSIVGVGMKATQSGQVVGTAISTGNSGQRVTIKDKRGVEHIVSITRISLQVNVGHYDVPNNSLLPTFVQTIADNVAGRDVDIARVLPSMLVLVVGFASFITIVFTAVRSTIVAIGRNPLATTVIRLGLLEVLMVALLIAVSTTIISYLILRL